MPRRCSVCRHEQRAAIDEQLTAGAAYRDIARQFAISKDALFRHREHIPVALAKAHEAHEVARADDLLGQVRDLQRRTLRVLSTAEMTGDGRVALGAIREARGNMELLARLLGELDTRNNVNVQIGMGNNPGDSVRAVLEQMRTDPSIARAASDYVGEVQAAWKAWEAMQARAALHALPHPEGE